MCWNSDGAFGLAVTEKSPISYGVHAIYGKGTALHSLLKGDRYPLARVHYRFVGFLIRSRKVNGKLAVFYHARIRAGPLADS